AISAAASKASHPSLGHCRRRVIPAFRRHRLALSLDGQRFGSRFWFPRRFLVGRGLPMEGRRNLSALDGLGQLRLRRTALYLLPAPFLDSWWSSQPVHPRYVAPPRFYRSHSDIRRHLGLFSPS